MPPPTSAALASFPRELLRNLTLRELRGKYKRSTLGYLWSVINPAVNLAIYTIVFGVFLDVRPPVGDPSGLEMYGFFLVAALLPWSFLTNSLTGSVGAMVGNEGLIKKVYFPRWVLPTSVILSFVVGFLVELAVLAVAFSFVGNVVIEFIPVILVLVVLELGFALGIGLALSVANVYFRDIEHFLGILLNVWFYATPILYPITQVPEETELFGYEIPMRSIVEANPMAGFAEAFRDCFYELPRADARHARHPHRLGRRVPPPGGPGVPPLGAAPGGGAVTSAIEVTEVSKRFRLVHERNSTLKATVFRGFKRTVHEDLWALEDIGFEVPKGTTFGIVGHNGSGKSTLLKCMASIYRPDHGSIRIDGRMSALLELGAGFHPELSGRENVYLNGSILGLSQRQVASRFDEIVAFSGLERFIDSPVKNYSSGMFVRLGFAVAINVEPEVLLVDEVLAVGDESFQQKCLERFADLRREGNTIVVVTHSLETVRNLCDLAVWLDHGHLMLDGLSGEVADAYLDSVQEERRAEHGAVEAVHAPGEAITEVAVLGRDGEPAEAVPFMGELTDRDDAAPRCRRPPDPGRHLPERRDPRGRHRALRRRGSTAHARLSGAHRAPGAGDLRRVGARVRPGGVVPRHPLPNEPLRRHRGPHPRGPRADRHGRDLVGPCLTVSTHPWTHLRSPTPRGSPWPPRWGSRWWGPRRSRWRSSATTTAWLRWPSPPPWAWDSSPGPPGRAPTRRRHPGARAGGTHRAGQPVPVATRLPVCVRRQGSGDLRRARPRHRREGDAVLDDPVLAADLPGAQSAPGARLPGVWTEGDAHSTSQFFHFFSSLTATAVDLTDERAAFHLNALLGALSAVVLTLAARRAFGLPTAAIAGGLLVISLPQVWQTKYPTTEILAQLLLGGAMLTACIAADRRSPVMGFLAGSLVGIGFLARPDGLLLVAITIAAGGLLLALDRVTAPVRAVALGLAITLPYALLNAYGLKRSYTLANDVPDLPIVAVGVVAGLVVARALRPVATRAGPWFADRTNQRRIGTVLAVGLLLVLGLFRERALPR